MVVSVLLIIYNLLVALLSGLVFTRLLSKVTGMQYTQLHPSVLVMLGWSLIAVLLQILHFFIPINLLAHIFVWLCITSVWVLKPLVLIKDLLAALHLLASKKHLALGVGVLILVVFNICSRSANGDIGDYHLQAVRWMEEYAVVPGLGNIRRQLGNNSNWFLLNAFAGCHFLGLRSVYTINAALVIVMAMYVMPHLQQKYWLRNLILLLYFLVVSTRKYTGALTNDLVITSGIIMVFVHFTDVMQHSDIKPMHLLLLIWLSAVLITYKLSALPLGVFTGLLLGIMYKRRQLNQKIVLFGTLGFLLLIIPWLLTNIINSGYLLFPFPNTNWFGVDWQMRPEIVEYEVYANLAYARAPEVDIEVARYFNISQWWPHWIHSLDGFSMVLLSVTGLLLIIMFSQLITNAGFRNQVKENGLWVVIVTTLLALILWFTHGPTPRFVFGYLVFTIAMGLTLFNNTLLQRILHRHYIKVVAIVLLVLIGHSFSKAVGDLSSMVWMPKSYTQANLSQFHVNGGVLWVPQQKQQCWDALLPCTNLPDTALEFRGRSLQNGFRIRQN